MSDLSALFAPRGIAVIGASADPAKMGSVMARSLATFDGPVVGINERLDAPRDGLFPSVAAAVEAGHGPIDLAVLCIPAPLCAPALDRAAQAGVRTALVCAGGFAEVDEAGAAHQAALAEVAARHGVRLLGPNTSGFLAPHRRIHGTFVPGAAAVPAGGVGVVAASGGVNHVLAFRLADAGYGVSVAVGLGNAVDVSTADVIDHLVADPDTTTIALHIESVADGQRLLESVRRAAAVKPVVALVVGKADVGDFAKSHTGALATAWRTTRSVLAQAGAVIVDDEQELVTAAGQLSLSRLAPSASPGVALVTAQAGPGLLVMDTLRSSGVAMPLLAPQTQAAVGDLLPPMTYQANPVDTGRPGETFGQIVSTVADDPTIDLVAVYALSEPDAVDLGVALRGALAADRTIAVGTGGVEAETVPERNKLIADGIATHEGPTALAVAVTAMVRDARQRHRAASSPRDAALPPAASALLEGKRAWDEDQAKELLGLLGISTPRRRAYALLDEARTALDDLDGPLAVKILDAAVLHKTDIGGVHLGVTTQAELDKALEALGEAGAERVLAEEMAPSGIDLIVGARRDPVFGPVVLLGLGGTVAEALADVAIAAPPLRTADGAALVDELAGAAVLHGWRGGPAADLDQLTGVLASLGQLLIDHPHLDEVEINPLRITREGLVALDAVITVRSSDGHADQ
ncbi:acetate--CoA ligase family protein [Nocardioides sp. NPDC051685]|uniref:acetate--CoA ligase family protein n=1 Tax=Nocardioides sp. NPDC051685 TaxID=3364334 RepID=UPI00379A4BC7